MNSRLRDLAEVHYGKSPNDVLSEDSTVPVIGTGGIYGRASRSLFSGPAVVVARKGTLGNPQFVNEPFWPVDTTYAVLAKPGVDTKWLYYSLAAFDLTKLNEATGVPSISRDWLYKVPLGSSNIETQRRIAEILSTLDAAIDQTEALIAKHQQIKAGLMHDLFTRGVTPDGHLRPTREQAPDLYKESPLGWIPKEWDCRPCSQICERITVGIVIRPTQYYVEHGVPAFRSANVRETGIDASDFVFISREANDLLAKSQVRAGDILTVRTGYPGTSAVVTDEFSGANAIDILLSRPTLEVNSFFLCYWINSSFGKGHVLKTQGGLAQQHFNVGELRDLPVALPKLDEQRAITERLDSLSQHIRCEESALAKWVKMKHGLMHDLLTGRVRVLPHPGPLPAGEGENRVEPVHV